MPQSLSIAAFVFGAVLVLLSLVVGKFKLFGAEIDGTVSKASRVIAFLFGIFLIARGLDLGANQQPVPAPAQQQAKVAEPQAVDDDSDVAPEKAAPPKAKKPVSKPQPAIVAESIDAPAPIPTPASAARQLEAYLPGVWRARVADPNTGLISESTLRFWSNGSFSGTDSALVNGRPMTLRRGGTWSARPVASDAFVLTINDAQAGIASYTFRVLDQNSVENQELHYIAHRIGQ
jgi:hypothetical protein